MQCIVQRRHGTIIDRYRMQLLVKDYLKTHTLRELEEEHGVNSRPNSAMDKFSLNYDMITVKNGDALAEQCRGLVIRVDPELTKKMLRDVEKQEDVPKARWRDRVIGDIEVLAWPMNRFYNYGDSFGATIDWSDVGLRVYEKLDGTMVVVYWDPLYRKWFAATRSVPEADLPIRKDSIELGDMTYSGLFFKALFETRQALSSELITWNVDSIDKIVHLNKEMTYVFELTSPYNRVVVKYDEPRVTLLAIRHTQTGKEVAIENARIQHVQRPKTWPLRSASALDAFVNAADPAQLEGAVVCDSHFNRLKVKNKSWVLSSRAKDLVTTSRRSAIESIVLGTIDDVYPLIEKEIAEQLQKMANDLRLYISKIDKNFIEWKLFANGSRKEFAIKVTESGDWGAPYFNMWENRAKSASEWIQSMAKAGKLSTTSLDIILKKIDG